MLKKFVLGSMTALVLVACGGEGGSASSSAPAQSANASGSLIERINNKGTITVGTEGTYAPFTYHDKNGKLTGYAGGLNRKQSLLALERGEVQTTLF